MVVGKASIHNIMEGMESTGGVRLHNHKRKLKHRFDIIKKLGQGTYGKVQLGINKETGQEVAIKTIKKCKIETEADLIRIRREVQIMSSVQHPNIIHIYEVFENREKMVLVMEYAAGGELYDYLSERKVLTEQEARRIFRQIAIAVYYCHKHKICHRDLKLENILLDQVGNAKIADFGLSNVFDEQKLMNTFCGSPLYASPEIVKGTPYHGPEVDCWSLGVLLYTLVYGAMPFDGSNFKRLVKQISQSDYFEPKNPSPASPLIKEMLTVCPTRRADIGKICTHWWVNEGYSVNCLDIAEDLAAETPVRLDLPLFLVPRSTSAEKLIVADQPPAADTGTNMSSETLVPTRCHSVGSLMELDQTSTDRRIRELIVEESGIAAADDVKAKLEIDATLSDSHNSKEWARRKSKVDDREPKAYKSASRHHSAPIPNTVNFTLGEIMEVEPTITVPTCKTADIHNVEDTAACLELIEECAERSPSKERSKTPVMIGNEQLSTDVPTQDVKAVAANANRGQTKMEMVKEDCRMEEPTRTVEEPNSAEAVMPASDNQVNSMSKLDTADHEYQVSASQDSVNIDTTQREFKKLKGKALSLDSDLTNETKDVPLKTVERRRSKIFETAEKFNQLASGIENDKPKKIFIPGVNVGGAKRVFERKASLSSITTPPPTKATVSKIIIDVPTEKKNEKPIDKSKQQEDSPDPEEKKEEAKRRAVDIISGAIGKPPVLKKINGSTAVSLQSQDVKKLPLKIPVGPNQVRSATVSVSTPVDTKYQFGDPSPPKKEEETSNDNVHIDEPKMSSKMEITLKSATLPRPRKTSKAEISLAGVKSEPVAFKTEVAAKIDAFQPQKLRTQRSEIAFPVAAAITQTIRSSSLEPESKATVGLPRERIIPIQVEGGNQGQPNISAPSPKPPMPQRSMSQRSGSLSRQSTADSDTDSALGSTVGPEPIRKSPREYIIPIAVEGGGYVTPRSGSVEPESKSSTPTSANAPPRSSRFARPRAYDRRILSDASEDESPFSSLHRDSEDLLHRHMHRLRSSRPSRQPSEHADSLSSGEDDDDDGFELLTAENLFSRLLSRVRSLTQRLNVDDTRTTDFPSSRLFARSPQAFWGLNKPLSRRLTESQFKHSLSREGDVFSRKDAANSSNPETPNSSSSREHATPSRESVFEFGSNTLPRDKVDRTDVGTEATKERLEENFTPSLARRLSRQLAEQNRRSLTRSSSVPYDKYNRPSEPASDKASCEILYPGCVALISDRSWNDEPPGEEVCGLKPSPSSGTLIGSPSRPERLRLRQDYNRSPRRSISLIEAPRGLDDYCADENSLAPFPKQVMTLGRRYKQHTADRSRSSSLRRDSFLSYRRAEKIQEEAGEQGNPAQLLPSRDSNLTEEKRSYATDNNSISECAATSIYDSASNLADNTTSSLSVKSCETSPTPSTANIIDSRLTYNKSDAISSSFEDRLLAAENLIKESKLKNLGPAKFNPNLCSSYTDTEKCEKESVDSISSISTSNAAITKRRSCIPSLRLRSGSLTREPGATSVERRKSFATSRDLLTGTARERREQPSSSPEKSLLSKFFRGSVTGSAVSLHADGNPERDRTERAERAERAESHSERKGKSTSSAPPKQHRISRFLRPDFFDTPREESRYVKEKEAQKAAENERRKSRFIRRKAESKAVQQESGGKDAKNEMNALKKGQAQEVAQGEGQEAGQSESAEKTASRIPKEKDGIERQSCKSSFLHSLEKKLERLRSNEDSPRAVGSGVLGTFQGRDGATARETSAPPVQCSGEHEEKSARLKKTRSVEDLRLTKRGTSSNQSTAKSKVSSVLGLFKNCEGRQSVNGKRAPSAILSKLKKSPHDTVTTQNQSEESSCSSSRIPSKYAKSESKLAKKGSSELVKKAGSAGDQSSIESKRSPPKEKPKEKLVTSWKERRISSEKQAARELKRSPEKSSPTTDATGSSIGELSGKSDSSAKTEEKKNSSESGLVSTLEDRKLAKTKKNALLVKCATGNCLNLDVPKKEAKKLVRPKEEQTEREKTEAAAVAVAVLAAEPIKKKKMVRVVKKIGRKSAEGAVDSKSEETVKSTKAAGRTTCLAKSERNAEAPPTLSDATAAVAARPATIITIGGLGDQIDSGASGSCSSSVPSISTTSRDSSCPKTSTVGELPDSLLDARQKLEGHDESIDAELEEREKQTAARNALKLDLSNCKIPQHSFRNGAVRRDSPKSESPRRNSEPKTSSAKTTGESEKNGENLSDKLLVCLSRMSHRASITGNKIIIEKPLKAKDVAQLKMEVTECARIIESGIADSGAVLAPPAPANVRETTRTEEKEESKQDNNALTELMGSRGDEVCAEKESGNLNVNDDNNGSEARDLLSPMDEAESFDSWSLSSLEFNQPRSELHSPGSPSSQHSLHLAGPFPFPRNDQSESIIDRIRRRSFYSRFNDRRRPSLTVPPPGVTLPTSHSSAIFQPRKYGPKLDSYGNWRDRHSARSIAIDDQSLPEPHRPKKSLSRELYAELIAAPIHLPTSTDTKLPSSTDYGIPSSSSSSSSAFEPVRRHLRSPTHDFSLSRARYHLASTDLTSEAELPPAVPPYRPGSASGTTSTIHSTFPAETFSDTRPNANPSYATLPRKYRSSAEPKTIEYYEELLAPTNPDYLLTRKSPMLLANEHPTRCENGYHNGNLDLRLAARRQSSSSKPLAGELDVNDADTQPPDGLRRKECRRSRDRETGTRSGPQASSSSSVCAALSD